MRLVDFKQQLKELNIAYEHVEEVYRRARYPDSPDNLRKTVINKSNFFAIINSFHWKNTKEGNSYWMAIAQRKQVLRKESEVCDYPILLDEDNLHVGCQILTPKQQMNLFKLLADQLGYEVVE